jgi:hypothetical protein
MDSSGTRSGGYDPEGPCGRTNVGERTPGTVGGLEQRHPRMGAALELGHFQQ